jgi:hypothetical protein
MSWDVSIVMRIDGAEHEVADCGNMTWNVGKMYALAFGISSFTQAFDGLQVSDAIPVLKGGIEYMRQHPDEMKALNPLNGWGSYESALAFLQRIYISCMGANPAARLSVC